ncbi:hypothetical protein, partial [Paenibacillus tarimensis]|uniref:hypothetical protein n=1 Tax=Paenibacillus tarimensis TaxID=416012 RepID=UPI001F44FD88
NPVDSFLVFLLAVYPSYCLPTISFIFYVVILWYVARFHGILNTGEDSMKREETPKIVEQEPSHAANDT